MREATRITLEITILLILWGLILWQGTNTEHLGTMLKFVGAGCISIGTTFAIHDFLEWIYEK